MSTSPPCGFGYSRIGHDHLTTKLPNQDAWGLHHYCTGSLAVVCDGLGSKTQSDFGARQAVIAAREAFRVWSRTPGAPARGFAALLNTIWNIRTYDRLRRDCATTCLVALLLPDRLVTAQLGDGLIATLKANESIYCIPSNTTGFVNETHSLGASLSLDAWAIHERDALAAGEQLLLCTDGVSESIDTEHLAAFMVWLRHVYSENQGGRRRYAALKKSFDKLPVAQRADDATLLTLWRAL